MLKDEINTLIMKSMKAHNKIRTETLRLIKSELVKAEKSKDYNETKVILKMIAAHKDSINQFKGRQDLIDKTNSEIEILSAYMPEQIGEEELSNIIEQAIKEVNATTIKDMGSVMKIVSSKVKGRADMQQVSSIIKSKLN